MAIIWWKYYDGMSSRFHLIPERHRQTEGQTDRFTISISCISMLTHDKKQKGSSSWAMWAHWVVQIAVWLALNQTPTNNVRPCCIMWYEWLLASFRWYSLCLPMQGWPVWVDLGGWLYTKMVYHPLMVTHPRTNRARRRPTTSIEIMSYHPAKVPNVNYSIN